MIMDVSYAVFPYHTHPSTVVDSHFGIQVFELYAEYQQIIWKSRFGCLKVVVLRYIDTLFNFNFLRPRDTIPCNFIAILC